MVIGVLPCAGHASRLRGIPKMLLPAEGSTLIELWIDRMNAAGIEDVLVLANRDNRKALTGIVGGQCLIETVETHSLIETLRIAQDATADKDILFAMPDTYVSDKDVCSKLVRALNHTTLAVGTWSTRPEQRAKLGMVAMERGVISRIDDKPRETRLTEAWGAASWKACEWQRFMECPDLSSAFVGGAIVPMSGAYWDCGTREELYELYASFITAGVAR